VAFIKTITADEAEGPVAEFYRRVGGSKADPANILKVQSISPATMETHYRFYRELMYAKSELSRAQRELIAVAVSAINECHY
jgi:alkylhydroperoxidase family enzyme